MMYIDSNIFVYAAIDQGQLGRDCGAIVKLIEDRKFSCASSLLTIDEALWIIKKKAGKELAIKMAKATISLPMRWMDVSKTTVFEAIGICEKTALDPRDAIHAAAMKEGGLTTILSEDSDFDSVDGIQRISASECLKKY